MMRTYWQPRWWHKAMVLIAAAIAPACARKAPGPDDCLRFAQLTFSPNMQEVLLDSTEKAQFDALVVACLTTPFERRVFVCAEESRAPLDCLRRYQPELFGSSKFDRVLPRRKRGYEVF